MNSSWSSLSCSSSSCKRKRDSDSFYEPRYKRAKNDVFVNYSFKDTGKSFVSHLKGGLTRNGFSISDHTMLPIGQDESSELVKAIEDSEIYVVVFSSEYAFSIKCLDELVLIMDSIRNFKKRKVFPIFLNVDPSHVRNQQGGSFMEAFQSHDTSFDPERVQKWRQALNGVGQLSGLIIQNGDEEKFLRRIVKLLNKMKNPLELFDATHPVGIESRVEDIVSKLRLDDYVFTIVAVLGIGGSGKTTIVKAVYDKIAANFDVRCFIENIHDYKNSGRNWKVDLQQKVISSLTGNYRFHNDGPAKIRRFITTQKVLLVLDDVDAFEQLQALGIHLASSFSCESRIILTTRNKRSLSNLPYNPYEISLLNEMESSELFTLIAYEKDEPVDKKFVYEIVHSAAGLPLVLDVWGRHFKTQDIKQWPSVLETLKRIPHEDIQKKLQISYDSLTNRAKKLFLDIACLFYGMKKDLVVKVLQDEDTAFFPEIEIQYLVEKGLVKIDQRNTLRMHRAIREMGKEVIRTENEDDPGQRTRLMDHRDVVSVLKDCSGTKSVEGIHLKSYNVKDWVIVQVEAFTNMINLRFVRLLGYDSRLQWYSSSNDQMSSFTFKKLRFLEWEGFPFNCMDGIDMGNVVVIILRHTKLEKLWEELKSLKQLRILDVTSSYSLTKTGNFAGLEKLDELCLSYCENLEELHSSIGYLKKLEKLDLSHCRKLKRFPWEMIGKLTSLVQLNLEMCSSILNTLCEAGSLPDSLCQLHELSKIVLSGCTNLKYIPKLPPSIKVVIAYDCISLVKLPFNMSELQSLAKLLLNGCYNLEPESFMRVTRLRNLQELRMRNCNVSQVPSEIENLVSLTNLDLSNNSFSRIPDSFRNLSKLEHLEISDCSQLKSIPNVPPNMKYIEARNCISLVNLPLSMSELHFLEELCLDCCFMLEPVGFMKVTELRNLQQLRMKNCNLSKISSEIENLVSLKDLDLSENTFSSLPDSFANLSQLGKLTINDCSRLELLPLLPSKLRSVEAYGCLSLDVMRYDSIQSAYLFRSKIFKESFFTKDEALWISLQGDEVPDWCSYQNKGDVLSFVAPMQLNKKICGVIVCATESSDYSEKSLSPTILNKTKETSHCFYGPEYDIYSMGVVFYVFCPLNDKTLVMEPGDTLHLQFKSDVGTEASTCGLCLIYENEVVDYGLLIQNSFTPVKQ